MKKIIIGLTLLASMSSFAANTLAEMTMAERIQDLTSISEKTTAHIETLEQLSEGTINVVGRGPVCFNLGSAFTSLRVLRTMTAGLEDRKSEIDDLARRAYSLKNKYCGHITK